MLVTPHPAQLYPMPGKETRTHASGTTLSKHSEVCVGQALSSGHNESKHQHDTPPFIHPHAHAQFNDVHTDPGLSSSDGGAFWQPCGIRGKGVPMGYRTHSDGAKLEKLDGNIAESSFGISVPTSFLPTYSRGQMAGLDGTEHVQLGMPSHMLTTITTGGVSHEVGKNSTGQTSSRAPGPVPTRATCDGFHMVTGQDGTKQ